jgi:hypothetical protein
MSKIEWKHLSEHPLMADTHPFAPRVLVYSEKIPGVEFGRVYRYPDGHISATAEGYHGDWNITRWAEIPDGPEDAT